MTSFIIKIMACLTMFLDHIKYGLPITQNFVTLYLGRLSFPLFAFLITEGYIHTSNLKRYYKRLVIFSIISQIPFMIFRTLVGEWKLFNIMFTLLLGLISITTYDKIENKFISIPIVMIIIFLGKLLRVDYGWFGIVSIFLIYILRNKKVLLSIIYGALVIIYYYFNGVLFLNNGIIYCFFTWLPTIVMMMYNGKQGKKLKYFFYWFYPIHLLIIYLLNILFV